MVITNPRWSIVNELHVQCIVTLDLLRRIAYLSTIRSSQSIKLYFCNKGMNSLQYYTLFYFSIAYVHFAL